MRKPDFENNLLRVLRNERPQRATLFELFLNQEFYERLAGHGREEDTPLGQAKLVAEAMMAAGYEHVPVNAADFHFPRMEREHGATHSINGHAMISDWESFEKYQWPDTASLDYSLLDDVKRWLPEGMKLMIHSPDGVLENVIGITGYDNLCIMLYEEPELVQAIFDQVGSRLVTYFENAAPAETVGFLCANDDWGFNTQTFLSPEHMRKYVFPWHKRIAAAAHRSGKPCILHSCGYYGDVIDDVVDKIGFDARHSYEDNIVPVEEAYEQLHDRIAILGGIDMNFLCTRSPEEIYVRSRAMLERTAGRGGYALGSGNSIPAYVPYEKFVAMTRAALDMDE